MNTQIKSFGNVWKNLTLSAAVLLSMAVNTFAQYSGGSGTADSPYQISTVADWEALAETPTDWGSNFVLTADVDFGGGPVKQIAPDTSSEQVFHGTAFTGVFDGNGHTLNNGKISNAQAHYIGVFGQLGQDGEIHNLGINDIAVSGYSYVGGLVGHNKGTITSCYVTGDVSGRWNTGGLMGFNAGTITSCYVTGDVSGRSNTGGLMGFNAGTITSCYATGDVSGGWSRVGGLVGHNKGKITSSYAAGSMTGGSEVGGLVGLNAGIITSSFATGSASGNSNVAGLAGKNEGAITSCFATGAVTGEDDKIGGLVGYNSWSTITACYAKGKVSGGEAVGGLVGWNWHGTIISCYATGMVSGNSGVGALVGANIAESVNVIASFWDKETSGIHVSSGGRGLTTAQIKTVSIFQNAGWGAYDWVMNEGEYARLDYEQTGASAIPEAETIPLAGDGTEDNPYQIGTVEEFGILNSHIEILDKYVLLTADLDFEGAEIEPVGDFGVFTGVFDRNGHVIRNGLINRINGRMVGVFRQVGEGGEIRNLGVEGINVSGDDYVGGLAGMNYGTITACYETGTVSGTLSVGGLVGMNDGAITACYATGTLTSGGSIGGLVGKNRYGTITACYATGMVSGNSGVGGLAGKNEGTIASCFATGAVTGEDDKIGGLVGYNSGSTITACYAMGKVSGGEAVGGLVGGNWYSTITSCYATGMVSGNSGVGGLIGVNVAASVSVIASFWDKGTSGIHVSAGGMGLTTAQMKTVSIFKNAGWGAYDWVMNEGEYARLDYEQTGASAIPEAETIPLAGDGTEDNPYQIGTVEEFGILNSHIEILDKYVLLTADLDFEGAEIKPVGDFGVFTGVFDGNGHVIRNGLINRINSRMVGVFRQVGEGGEIRNLGVEGINVSGDDYVGGLVGLNGGMITACYATGAVSGNNNVAGLVGKNEGTITACYATGTLTSGGSVGGLVAYNTGGSVIASFWDKETNGIHVSSGGRGLTTAQMQTISIFQCAGWGAYDWVMNEGEYPRLDWEGTGAQSIPEPDPVPLSGNGTEEDPYQVGTVEEFELLNSYAELLNKYIILVADLDFVGSDIEPIGCLGAFNGVFDGNGHIIERGIIDRTNAGFLGIFKKIGEEGIIRNLGLENIVVSGSDCIGILAGLNKGAITSCYAAGSMTGGWDVGGLVGVNDGTITDCYATAAVTGKYFVGGLVGENNATITDCYATATVMGKSYCGGLVGRNYNGAVTACYWDVDTSSIGASFGGVARSKVQMTYPYSTNTYVGWDFEETWEEDTDGRNSGYPYLKSVPINAFPTYSGGSGTSDDPYQINTVADWEALADTPLHWDKHFILTDDLNFDGGRVEQIPEFTGEFNGAKYVLCNGNNINASADYSGIFGRLGNTGLIYNLGVEDVSVTGTGHTGGLVGFNDGGIIAFCYTTGPVTADSSYGGGLVGYNSGTIFSCYSRGAVSNASYTGGLVGNNSGIINSCYATGASTGNGLVGWNNLHEDGEIIFSYWDINTSGTTGSSGGEGRSTDEMTYPYSTNTFAVWDFDDIWAPDVEGVNDGYPYFRTTPQPSKERYNGGSGTEDDPYKINTVADWETLAESPADWNNHFILTADLDFDAGPVKQIAPLNFDDVIGMSFTGTFNGNGYTLKNGNIDMPFNNRVGVFGRLKRNIFNEYGEIRNLGLEDITVSGNFCVGGLVAINDGTITSCFTTGEVNGDRYVGGLVFENNGIITSCYTTGAVIGGNNTGGLVDINSGTIINCYSSGEVTGTGQNIGGLVNHNKKNGKIISSYAIGKVSIGIGGGGLVNYNEGIISSCYAMGAIIGYKYVAGLCGLNEGSITSCYAVGRVANSDDSGGLVEINSAGTITSSYWDTETSQVNSSAGGEGRNTIQMTYPYSTNTYVNWDFEETWMADTNAQNGGYPYLQSAPLESTFVKSYSGGFGTDKEPYRIGSTSDWELLTQNPEDWGKNFILITNLDFSGGSVTQIAPDTSNDPDFQGTPFTGVIDGNGYTLSNGKIIKPESDYVGVIGQLCKNEFDENGEVRNLSVKDITVSGNEYVGGLAAFNNGNIISCNTATYVKGDGYVGGLAGNNGEKGTISSCYSIGDVLGSSGLIGGLAGENSGTITSCHASGNLDGNINTAGGLVGLNSEGNITFCYAIGNVNGNAKIGGLVGANQGFGTIVSCYARGAVSGYKYVGGLVGSNEGAVSSCFATGNVTCHSTGIIGNDGDYAGGLVGINSGFRDGSISSCYSTGIVIGEDYVGGLVGQNDMGAISSSFWNVETSKLMESDGGAGRNTDKMTFRYSSDTFRSWDFRDTWVVDTDNRNNGYPYLQNVPLIVLPSSPELRIINVMPDHTVEMSIETQSGHAYEIQASTDLSNWATITNLTATNASTIIRDSDAANYEKRFYRAVAQ